MFKVFVAPVKHHLWSFCQSSHMHPLVIDRSVCPFVRLSLYVFAGATGYVDIIVIPSQQCWRGYSNGAVILANFWSAMGVGSCVCVWGGGDGPVGVIALCGGVTLEEGGWGELATIGRSCVVWWVSWCVRVTLYLVDRTRYRLKFLPNHFQTAHVSCSWSEEGPYWFEVTGSKVKGTLSIKTLWARYRLQFLPDRFQTSHVSCSWSGEVPIYFGSQGQMSRSTLALRLSIKPCGHDTGYCFCPITFKIHL